MLRNFQQLLIKTSTKFIMNKLRVITIASINAGDNNFTPDLIGWLHITTRHVAHEKNLLHKYQMFAFGRLDDMQSRSSALRTHQNSFRPNMTVCLCVYR